MLVEVAGVPPLVLVHFQCFSQLLLRLLLVHLLYFGCYPLVVVQAHAYDYDCLYSACL